ncbi:MAG: DUF523 domain-containing protein [Magnetococcales bacterium]|nr:DUF523 domain-containing protein [Magnetococcales bacterium]MBF0113591.1 DUF523 domain-containing protein [Magnetococcales bacterium]
MSITTISPSRLHLTGPTDNPTDAMTTPDLADHAPPVPPVAIAISACLLGVPVRYDGGHKKNPLLVSNKSIQWIPFCPEHECGLGTPREPMQWQGAAHHPRLCTVETQRDHTQQLWQWCHRQVHLQSRLPIAGWLLKSRSPSCGLSGVTLLDRNNQHHIEHLGLFPRLLLAIHPQAIIAEGDCLHDETALNTFLQRITPPACHRTHPVQE